MVSCEIALIWMSLDFINDQSTLGQVMVWCCQATSHYLSQCWPRSLPPYSVTRPERVKVGSPASTLRNSSCNNHIPKFPTNALFTSFRQQFSTTHSHVTSLWTHNVKAIDNTWVFRVIALQEYPGGMFYTLSVSGFGNSNIKHSHTFLKV